jgi:hypothetical protein
MKRHQNNIARMWLNVDRFLTDNAPLWSTIITVVNTVTKFRIFLDQLGKKAVIQLDSTKGVTRAKNVIREDLTDANMQMAANIKAWADDNNDPQMSGEMTFERSMFDRLSETRLITVSSDIRENAQTISLLPQAGDYNITAATLAQHDQLIGEFVNNVTRPQQIRSVRKAATTSIPVIIKQGQTLLDEKLDKQMYNFKKSNPDFFAAYQNVRQIIDYGEDFNGPNNPPPPAPPQ